MAPQKDRDDTVWQDHILAIANAQDQTAFAALFHHFAPRIKAFLMKSGLDHTMAEDCTQDVMATLWHKAHLYDPARATPAAWIFTIARNRKIDLLRKSTRQDPDILPWGPEAAPDQADVIAQREMAHVLTQAIGDLPRTQQDMIKQAYFGDLSHQEISDKTGLPLGTIKSRIRLAMERLRHTMKTTRGD